MGNDNNIDRFTCRNASVVDYCITSHEFLKLLFDFDILESSKLFSDVHAPLQMLLSVNLNNNDGNSNTVRKTNHSKAKIKSWENEKVTDFQENIDEEKLHTFEQKLSRWQNEIGVTDQVIIDSLEALAISSRVLPRKRLEHLKTLIVKLTRIKMVKI